MRNTAGEWELYDLQSDPKELTNLIHQKPERIARLRNDLEQMEDSLQASLNGADYEY